jgi:hypothetical protein
MNNSKYPACSSFCHKDEPCSITQSGECDTLHTAARRISEYLTLGMHHSTPEAQGQIVKIIKQATIHEQ